MKDVDQSQNSQRKVNKNEELIKCMSKLPTYLERHDNPQDKVLSVGVLDWDRLEKWQCNQKHHSNKTSKFSASSSDNSSFFSADLSSDCSSRCNSRSPARQKIRRPTLLCHLNASPHKSDPQNIRDSCIVPSSKGKTKILERGSFKESRKSQEVYCNIIQDDRIETRKNVVLLPTNGQMNSPTNKVTHSALLSSKFKDFGFVEGPKISTSSSRNKIQEEKKVTRIRINATSVESLSCVNPKASTSTDNNARSQSPARRLIASLSRITRNSGSRDFGEVLAKNGKDQSEVSSYNPNLATSRARSSPLRRLLEPLLKPKITNTNQVPDVLSSEGRDRLVTRNKLLSTQQALLQVSTKKNGVPMYTFAVENNTNILAATMRKTEVAGKTEPTWIYTFFTVEKTKRKSGIWLNQNGRVQGEEYVPNVVAQMKVSEKSLTKEFVLFDTDSGRLNVMEPNDEVAAVVMRRESGLVRSTVILPGGNHGLAEKGEPWPLIDRWKSGGLCDCGGWDLGCRVRVFADRSQAGRLPTTRFELFSQQGEVLTEKPIFSLCTFKNGIYSAEFSSALSYLQAFAICIALLDSKKPLELSA